MTETLTLLDELFSDTGLLSRTLPSYEAREGQQRMAREIWEAFKKEHSALFEAGTGIGKSVAYLIPALLWSYRTGEKVVVSTYTISLQEQLLEKDIPMLLNALGLDLHVVIAKGMQNYVCLRKVDEVEKRSDLFEQEDALISWAKRTSDGTKSSLPFADRGGAWNKISAESEVCTYVKCPHYKRCFFFNARSKVQDADLIIVNHHLLMNHLLAEEKKTILPPFSRLIIDEAHHLESVARSCLTQSLDRIKLFKSMARVHSDGHPEVSRFFYLQQVLAKKNKALDIRLGIDLPGEKRDLLTKVHAAFDVLDEIFSTSSPASKWRLTPQTFQAKVWEDKLIPAFEEMKSAVKRYTVSLDNLEKEFDEETKEKVETALLEISATSEKLKEAAGMIEAFFSEKDSDKVRWAEKTYEGTTLSASQLDVAPFLEEKLFSSLKSSVLCSATLTVGGEFHHLKRNLGIPPRSNVEKIYPSPFDFKERTRLLGVSDIPPPSGYAFTTEAIRVIHEAIDISKGGAFVLFTSYDTLNRCAEGLSHLPILKQGDLSRHLLLEEFKKKKDSVLLGTDSFWEGVDVAGDALRLVIIVKLPFPVPSEPLLQARGEKLKQEGLDPFMEDSVPQAVMKFKQGFGRLMRRKSDRGCVLCLDQRLFTRGYGNLFFKSLPECVTSFAARNEIYKEMKDFYRDGA